MLLSLFDPTPPSRQNLLPQDGTVYYFGAVYARQQSDHLLQVLLQEIAWKNDEAIIMGKHIVTKRKAAWYGDKPFPYTYSRITKTALPWTDSLKTIKTDVERWTGETYNSCLLNLYHTGEEGMAWHSDGEPDLKKNGAIASVSFGAVRKFAFKHKKTGETVDLQLEHGSLLVMKDTTQTYWLHRLPPTRKITLPRVNLTFRTIVTP